jgi:hypothetical protein
MHCQYWRVELGSLPIPSSEFVWSSFQAMEMNVGFPLNLKQLVIQKLQPLEWFCAEPFAIIVKSKSTQGDYGERGYA